MINRRAMWSESTEDISAFQRLALDGGLAVAPESQAIVTLALAHHTLQADSSGNVRLVKTHGRRSKRDDVIQAGVVAAGQLARTPKAIEGPRIRIVRRGQAA